MADITRLGEINLPKFSDKMDPEDQRQLRNYLDQQHQQLLYMMQNLDESNLSDSMRDKLAAMGLRVD